ncbi:MAG: hypothetical protein GX605_05355 [Chloroflexi bacterium]|nr:hypothetical protein [Chloroflexota bacterium]
MIDTGGLVAPAQGGLALKQWKIALLQPDAVVCSGDVGELRPLLEPLRASGAGAVWELPRSKHVQRRDRTYRAARRERLLAAYLAHLSVVTFSCRTTAIFNLADADPGRLASSWPWTSSRPRPMAELWLCAHR